MLDINQVARNLAVEMTARTGELWRALIKAEDNPALQSPTAFFQLSEHWNTHRLTIHACAPHTIRERTTGETITADPERKPEAIAADICSRILAHAREHMLESIAYDQERKQKEAEKQLRLHFLKKYLPREYQSEKLCNSDNRGPANIFAHITYDNLINLEITLPLRDILAVLKFLQERNPHK